MISSYEVGSIFRIVDEASPALERIAKLAQDVDAQVELAKKNLQAFGRVSLAGISARFTKTSESIVRGATVAGDAIARIGTVSEATAGTFAASFGAMNADIRMAIANTDALTASLRAAGGAARTVGASGVAGAATGAAATGARAGVLGGAVSRGGTGAGHGVSHATGFHGRLSIPAPVGHVSAYSGNLSPGAVGAGGSLLGIFEALKQSIEPAHQTALLKLLGMSDKDVASLQEQAWKTVKAAPGTTFGQALATEGEMYSIVGTEGAVALSQPMAIMERVLASQKKGGKEGEGYTLTRATELMGQLTDPDTHRVDLAKF
jgi:hypothetical protein